MQPSNTGSGEPVQNASPEQPPSTAAIDPLGKFDPPIVLTTGRTVEDTGGHYEPGKSIDNNKWYDLYKDELGIEVKNTWVVNGSQAGESKKNVAIASGDIPDVLSVNAVQLKNLVDAGMLEDLTDVYNQYASPLAKEIMEQDGGYGLTSATFDGKLYALPVMNSAVDNVSMLWVRTDWLKKLGLSEPKSMSDVVQIAEAFVTRDPDGNQKDDTFGIGVTKEPNINGVPTLQGFFNGYHAYPGIWVKGQDGKLVYGSVTPEMKPALQQLAEMFKSGLIDKEFGVKDTAKLGESITASKLGLFYGPMWTPIWGAVKNNKTNDPDAEWASYPLLSADGSPALAQTGFAVSSYNVLKKGFKNPEAIVKMLNVWIDKSTGPNMDYSYMTNVDNGIQYFKYAVVQAWPIYKNLDVHHAVMAAFKSGDTSKLDPEQKTQYDNIAKWRSDPSDVTGWGYNLIFGDPSSYNVIDNYIKDNRVQPTEFFGAPTPAMAEKSSTLKKMEDEMITKIILGAAGIEEFDKFVNDWYKLGGEQMTAEVNEWAKH